MSRDVQSEESKALDQVEHNSDASAKRVSLRVFNTETGQWENSSLSMGKIVWEQFDYIDADYPSSTTETYTYKLGGSGGTTVAVVTVTYTDSSKDNVDTVSRA